MGVDENGSGFTIEWCFGKQGQEGSWRVMYSSEITADHGSDCAHDVVLVRLTHTPLTADQSTDLQDLDKWLKEAVEEEK
jgi:hypothetical protein